jgi:hypothetical protein
MMTCNGSSKILMKIIEQPIRHGMMKHNFAHISQGVAQPPTTNHQPVLGYIPIIPQFLFLLVSHSSILRLQVMQTMEGEEGAVLKVPTNEPTWPS